MSPSKKRRKRIYSTPIRKGTKRYYAQFGYNKMLKNSRDGGKLGNMDLGFIQNTFLLSSIIAMKRKFMRNRSKK